jgi:hypothetical protein
MKMLLTAIAIAIAFPAVAHAQQAPEPAKPMACCEKMKAEGKECGCCKDMKQMDHSSHGGAAGADSHSEHSGAADTPQPAHQNH